MPTYRPAYRLTLFASRLVDPSETTILSPVAGAPHSDPFKITTLANLSGWKPYLWFPKGRRGRTDLLSKKTDTGELTVQILDARVGLPSDNASRWVTAFIGDSTGAMRLGGYRALVEESLDGGQTWASFFVGRTFGLQLQGRLNYVLTIRDIAQDLQRKVFVGKPHAAIYGTGARTDGDATDQAGPRYAQLLSTHPIGILNPYGTIAVTQPFTGTVDQSDSTNKTFRILLDAASKGSILNLLTQNLAVAMGAGFDSLPPITAQQHQTLPPNFTGPARIHVKNLNTSAEGDFLVGILWADNTPTLQLPTLGFGPQAVIKPFALVAKPLQYPIGVATGTPLVNNIGGYAIGTTSIATDGWTISTTGILKQGDIISFAGHSQRYIITADTNSDGSGNSTLAITPALTASVANNEAITVQSLPGFMALPANGTPVAFSVIVDRQIDQQNPLLLSDNHPVQVWKDVLRGYYGYLFTAGTPLALGKNFGDPLGPVGFNATAFNDLIADKTFPTFRCVIDQPMSAADFIEKYICLPNSLGYYLDGSGNVVPVDLRMPTSLAGVPTITDADLALSSAPDWQHDPNSAVTVGSGKFYAEVYGGIQVQTEPGYLFPVITSQSFQTFEQDIIDLGLGNAALGDKKFEIDAKGLRFMPYETIASLPGATGVTQSRALWCQQRLQGMLSEVARPFGNGPQILKVPLRRTANTAGLFPGSLVIVNFTAAPDTTTNKRNGTRLARVSERIEQGLVVQATLFDLGINVIANTPTLGNPAQVAGDTAHSASTVVTLDAQSDVAEVHYAITDTATATRPVDSSALWTPVRSGANQKHLFSMSQTVVQGGLPAGCRVWFRARSLPMHVFTAFLVSTTFSEAKLPSAWVYPATDHVDLAGLTAPTGLAVSGIASDAVHLSWTVGDANLRLEVWLATPVGSARTRVGGYLPPGTTGYDLLGLEPSTTYRVAVRDVDGAGGFAESATVDFTTNSTPSAAPNCQGILVLAGA